MESSTVALTGPLDPREGWVAERCPIARTLEVVSTKSAFLILREAFYGTTRFDDFAKRAQVSDPVAAARLSELVEEGLLAREPYQEPGQRTRRLPPDREVARTSSPPSWRRCSGATGGLAMEVVPWSYDMRRAARPSERTCAARVTIVFPVLTLS